MTPSNHSNGTNGHSRATGMTQDDVYFTLFRHKWLILGFICLGIAGAIGVRVLRPPLYMAVAKLMVQNVSTLTTKPTGDEQQFHSTDQGAQSTIAAEGDLITSGDVAMRAAEAVGPAKILAMKGGGNNLQSAAGVVSSGLTVEPPRTAVITDVQTPGQDGCAAGFGGGAGKLSEKVCRSAFRQQRKGRKSKRKDGGSPREAGAA